jgi:hypothetical protein
LDILWQSRDAGEDQCADGDAGPDAEVGEAAPETAMVLIHVLDEHQHPAAPLGAGTESLSDPCQDEQDWCPDSNRGVVRQDPDYERARTHQDHAGDEDLLTAVPVAEVTTDDAADRPDEKAAGKSPEGCDHADCGTGVWEEQVSEVEAGRQSVDVDIEELDCGAE